MRSRPRYSPARRAGSWAVVISFFVAAPIAIHFLNGAPFWVAPLAAAAAALSIGSLTYEIRRRRKEDPSARSPRNR